MHDFQLGVDVMYGPYMLTSFLVAATSQRGSMFFFSFPFVIHPPRYSVGLLWLYYLLV